MKTADIDAKPGEKRFPKETYFIEDLKEYWGDWDVSSEVDKLRAVLMRRPGKEIEKFDFLIDKFQAEILDIDVVFDSSQRGSIL